LTDRAAGRGGQARFAAVHCSTLALRALPNTNQMTVLAADTVFTCGGVEHLDVIVAHNIAMAKETEDLDLPPAIAHRGVEAVLQGTHQAQVRTWPTEMEGWWAGRVCVRRV